MSDVSSTGERQQEDHSLRSALTATAHAWWSTALFALAVSGSLLGGAVVDHRNHVALSCLSVAYLLAAGAMAGAGLHRAHLGRRGAIADHELELPFAYASSVVLVTLVVTSAVVLLSIT